jgi:hypothetical protein
MRTSRAIGLTGVQRTPSETAHAGLEDLSHCFRQGRSRAKALARIIHEIMAKEQASPVAANGPVPIFSF